jgi:hypothetical protein
MRTFLSTLLAILTTCVAHGTGEPSTYFNIYVPPNNDNVQRNVCLVITAIYDNTEFTVVDDGMDGDTDDSVQGVLMAGQSYILYIKDNGINDDASSASTGIYRHDGDYFIITSNKIVYASQSTDSDWQHDFVPATNKSSLGNEFIVYAPKISSSKRDLNVFAYSDSTTVTISRISTAATTTTGYTQVDRSSTQVVAQRMLMRGQDIIHYFTDGRNVMNTGETYLVEANRPVSLQYGALFGNERDGGGYVPSSNGSSTGDLFYFAVPYQALGEQEIPVISWDAGNNVTLERYNNGNLVSMTSWTIDRLKAKEWVGKSNGNVSYPTVFRVTCTPGKRVSVFEANWLETGNPGTSDIGATVLEIGPGDYIASGWTMSGDGDLTGLNGNMDGWIMRLSDLALAVDDAPTYNATQTMTVVRTELRVDLSPEVTQAWLIDVTGRVVHAWTPTSGVNVVQIGHLPSGAYLLRTTEGRSERFLKE